MSLFKKYNTAEEERAEFQKIYISYFRFLSELHKKPPAYQEVIGIIYAQNELY